MKYILIIVLLLLSGCLPLTTPTPAVDEPIVVDPSPFVAPLDRPTERVTKKPFGIFIEPATSPVSPERFRGYHTGVDFEIFDDEVDRDVVVSAFCDGPIISKRTVGGYGGVLIQSCSIDGQPVTALYGHLRLSSVDKNTGDQLAAGDVIGLLGDAYSDETSGERKHLHFSLHRGGAAELRGYVSSVAALTDWLDPSSYVNQ